VIAYVVVLAVVIAVIVAPIAAYTALRAVGRAFELMREIPRSNGEAVEARLARIEEAIDAMALQIDRLARERELRPEAPERRQLSGGIGSSDS